MKHLTIALTLLTAPAMADSLHLQGLDDPEVIAPAGQNWTGLYAGLSYGRVTEERTTIIPGTAYNEATCTRGTGSSAHENNKCRLDQALWDALQAATVKDPWNVPGYRLGDATKADLPVKYQSGYPGAWMGGMTSDTLTWPIGQHAPDVAALNAPSGQDAVLSVAQRTTATTTLTEAVSGDEAGAFAGYRKDWGRIVGGVELGVTGDLATAEAQVGFDAGRVLIYGLAGYGEINGEGGAIYGVGADVMLGKRVMIGVKAVASDFGAEAVTARVGVRF
jgi:hypothetical protein